MKRLISLAIAIATATSLATPVLAQDLAERQSERAGVIGDWAQVVVLSGQSYRRQPTLENEFNLATGYEHTGQIALAIPLYADVAKYGEFTHAVTLYDYSHGARVQRAGFNYSEEANRRLAMLTDTPVAPDVE
ncbi:MAG: hypothetical protein ACXWKM_00190 [Phenylobacterium sp.]